MQSTATGTICPDQQTISSASAESPQCDSNNEQQCTSAEVRPYAACDLPPDKPALTQSDVIRLMAEAEGGTQNADGSWSIVVTPIKSRRGRKMNDAHRALIAALYPWGLSQVELGHITDFTHNNVGNTLRRMGIPLRTIHEVRRLQYPCNEHAFDHAEDDPVAAYWVGFLMADGSIDDTTPGQLGLSCELGERDADQLVALTTFLGVGRSPLVYDYSPGGKFSVGSTPLCSALARYGVVPRKSTREEVFVLENDRHFWRGMFDGDGTVVFDKRGYPRADLCGSRRICEQFHEFTATVLGVSAASLPKVFKYPHADCYDFGVNGSQAQILLRHLYTDAPHSLPFKRDRAAQAISWTGVGKGWRKGNGPKTARLTAEQVTAAYESCGYSWKEAAKYLRLSVATLIQARRRLGLPVEARRPVKGGAA